MSIRSTLRTLFGIAEPTRFSEPTSLTLIRRRGWMLTRAVAQVARENKWDEATLRRHQFDRLRGLVIESARHVRLYRDKYRSAGFDPDSLRTWADLDRIPFLDKEELRSAPLEYLRHQGRPEPRYVLSSSGSTGIPSRIYREEEALWYFMARGFANYHEWTRSRPLRSGLYILDFAAGSVDSVIADLLRTTVPDSAILASDRPAEELASLVRERRPEFLSTYPSTLRNIGQVLERTRRVVSSVRLIHLTSEMLDRNTRALANRVFPNARLMESYSCTEAGLAAYPCPLGDRYHINEAGVIVEIVDADGRPTGGSGRVVVTDLTNMSTPIIRYRGLGDFARWETTPCRCGSPCRSIRGLEGRVTDSIRKADGAWLSPYEIIDAVEDLPGIHQFQIVQHADQSITVRLIRDPRIDRTLEEIDRAVTTAVSAKVGRTGCRTEFVASIEPIAGRHKVPLVVSHLRRGDAS